MHPTAIAYPRHTSAGLRSGRSSVRQQAGGAHLVLADSHIAPGVTPGVTAGGDERESPEIMRPAGAMQGAHLGLQPPVREAHDRVRAVGREAHFDEGRLRWGLKEDVLPAPCEDDPSGRVELDELPEHGR